MSKASKKATKRKKADKKVKKKKQMKKLGLTRFIPEDKNKRNKVKAKPQNVVDQEELEGEQKPKQKVVNLKRQQKDMSLVDRCRLQMSSSLLRLIDEKLYSSDTSNISLNKDEFKAYHSAYNKVSESWPSKPIDYIVKFIKKRLFTKKPVSKFRFADVGCGQLPLLKMKLPAKANVESFDIVSAHKDVTEANMDQLPLADESVDCAIYSLSLMAKNLGNILLEAKRILKPNGSLLIVEVTSRFEGREKKFLTKLERIGLKKKSMTTLKPNAYFTFFHLYRSDNLFKFPPSHMNIELKPCVYKAR